MNLKESHAGRQMKLLTYPALLFRIAVWYFWLCLVRSPQSHGRPAPTSNLNPNPNRRRLPRWAISTAIAKCDILWRNSSTEQVYFWLMNGTTFTSSGAPAFPPRWVIPGGVGDFDGDARATFCGAVAPQNVALAVPVEIANAHCNDPVRGGAPGLPLLVNVVPFMSQK